MHRDFFNGFRYAFSGIRRAIKEERNLRFHLCAAFYVYLFSLFYNFTRIEYVAITIIIGVVLALELVNSSIERTQEKPKPYMYMTAGAVKDMAAGAVLIFCIAGVICGIILFWDIDVFIKIYLYFKSHLIMLIPLIISLLVARAFVFKKK
ncbi:MAG: diacylglycerol kinase family protein [Oscillospiraceae bacterium]